MVVFRTDWRLLDSEGRYAARGLQVSCAAVSGHVVRLLGACVTVVGELSGKETKVSSAVVQRPRCGWVKDAGALDVEYHDREWGVPRADDAQLFEALTLEGAQAGLSWSTILKKREGYRRIFAGFDPSVVSEMPPSIVEAMLVNPEIVRHRGKIESTLNNAVRVTEVQAEFGTFGVYLWGFVEGAPVQGDWERHSDLPSTTEASTALSKDLKRRGFRFVGPTTCYAFMQAVGMVNDHERGCFRHGEVRMLARDFSVR